METATRLVVGIDEDMMNNIDNYAKDNYLDRAKVTRIALSEFFKNKSKSEVAPSETTKRK